MSAKILFVCLGNICRSPSAEGVMQKLVDDNGLSNVISIDSAGTGSWHVGERADSRMRSHALRHFTTDITGQNVTADTCVPNKTLCKP